MPTPREQLANILRQSRLDAGYESHGALAKRLNVSRPVVTRAENAAHPAPSDAVLAAWAGATGAGLDTLTDLAQRAKSGTPDWFMPDIGEPHAAITRSGTICPSHPSWYRALHRRRATCVPCSKTKVTCSTGSMSLLPPGLSGNP